MIEKEEKPQQVIEKLDRNANKSQSKSIVAKKTKNNYSQIDKE